jgi:hypothetical protein
MQKWEYCKIDKAKQKLIQYTLSGTKVSTLSGSQNIPELVIARLGNTGWEAFHLVNDVWFFKRPLTE